MSLTLASEASDSIAVRAALLLERRQARAVFGASNSARCEIEREGQNVGLEARARGKASAASSAALRASCSAVSAASGSMQLSMAEMSLSPAR